MGSCQKMNWLRRFGLGHQYEDGELRLPHPEGRKAWLRAEIESMFLKRSSHDKLPLLDVC